MRYLLPERPLRSLDEYLATDTGGLGLARAQAIGAVATIDELERSGLRGRGGAGFPTGRKWESIASSAGPHYAVCNGAEGEPATFKDRALLRNNPYQLVEGLLIAAFAVEAKEVFIALKASFREEVTRVTDAVQQMQQAGICRDCTVNIVQGPDEYLFGEETALLEVIEGKAPLPRLVPPYQHGLYATSIVTGWEARTGADAGNGSANPTLVNNVETLSSVPHIMARGADWFRSMGTAESPGNIVCTVVGDVVAPDVGEVELGTPLAAVIDLVGSGLVPGRAAKAVVPGVAAPVVTDLTIPVSHEGFDAAGSAMGAAGFTVLNESTCMVAVALELSRFLYVESCGQCPPCKLGSGEITTRLERIEAGECDTEDLGVLQHWLDRVTDGNRCYLAVQERLVTSSILAQFANEVEEHVTSGACPRPRPFTVPTLLDLRGGTAVYDERQSQKQPDWSYEADRPFTPRYNRS
jgi:NADH:ubiquinone oxidoreductase subunit F (NADH-binding)